jgi:TonB family protein
MDFFSDPQATRSRFSDVIDDLHDVFRCHGVDFGSPDDFLAFARTMKYHSELRSDVMRVVKFVMDSEMNVSFRTLLTILAVASGGTEVGAGGREMRVPVSMVIESLVGAGDSSPLNGEQPESSGPEPIADEAVETVALERSSSCGEEPAASPEAERVFVEEPAGDSSIYSSIDYGPLMGRSDSNALAESLSRIEMNSLQLKIYLDSIEQRISRMEPRLENVPPGALSGPPAPVKDKVGARFSAAVGSATISSSSSEPGAAELLHDQPARVASRQEATAAMRSREVLTHLWRDSRQFFAIKKERALPVLGGFAILLFAASVWWVGRDTGYAVIRPASASAQEPDNAGGSSRGAAVAKDTSAADIETAPRNSQGPVDSDAGQRAQRLADAPVPSPKKPARAPLRSPLSSSPAGDTKTAVAVADTSDVTEPADRTSKLSSEPVSDHPLNVSSGVMAANLLSGPKPSYPALASMMHTRGDVVMLAVISKKGTVKDLHVIKGHRLLRGAAKSAVRSWRYRPYRINGVPVDVSTLVHVDFSSPQ